MLIRYAPWCAGLCKKIIGGLLQRTPSCRGKSSFTLLNQGYDRKEQGRSPYFSLDPVSLRWARDHCPPVAPPQALTLPYLTVIVTSRSLLLANNREGHKRPHSAPAGRSLSIGPDAPTSHLRGDIVKITSSPRHSVCGCIESREDFLLLCLLFALARRR